MIRRLNKHLKCPVCLLVPCTGTIFQCKNGHIVCGACRKMVTKCPTCRIALGQIRCLVAEQMLAEVDRSCQNDVHGCDFRGTKDVVDAHYSNCPHRPVRCPIQPCGKEVGIQAVMQHVRESHSTTQNEVTSAKRNVVKDDFSVEGDNWDPSFCFTPIDHIEIDGKNFFTQIWRSDELCRSGEWYFWVYCVGLPEESNKFSFQITLGNKVTRVSYKAQTISIFHYGFAELCKFGNPLTMSDAQIKKLSSDDTVKYKWELFRN